MRVVVSMTTLPGRARLLERAIASLRRQTRPPDAIYLWLPEEHFGTAPSTPAFPGVQVATGPDLGPAMKLLPLLCVETDPETCMIPIDDDIEYPPDLVEKLLNASALHSEQAIGFTGWIFQPNETGASVRHMNEEAPDSAMFQPVHVLEGYRGVLYRRGFFEHDIHDHLNALPAFRLHDDILLSGYLASRGIVRTVSWYGSAPAPARDHWKLHGEDSGLHTTPGWLEQGRACVDYWGRHARAAFPAIAPMDASTRLQLCASSYARPGFTYHRHAESAGDPGSWHDLNDRPWPWRDGQFRELLVLDPIEGQIPSPMDRQCADWLDECLRILKPGGYLKMRIPKAWAPGYRSLWHARARSPIWPEPNNTRNPSRHPAHAPTEQHPAEDEAADSIQETQGHEAIVTFFKRPKIDPAREMPEPTKRLS